MVINDKKLNSLIIYLSSLESYEEINYLWIRENFDTIISLLEELKARREEEKQICRD